jgi:hypothetical protein
MAGSGNGKQDAWITELITSMLRGPTEGDVSAAVSRVAALRTANPERRTDELVEALIRRTARRAAAIGAVTAGAALMPGAGTVAALTIGSATDVGATMRLQTQMVLDIAALHGADLSGAGARNAILVAAGVSGTSTALLNRAGRAATLGLGKRFAARWLLRAVPVIGMLSSSGTNALATQVIGRRADAYFSLGPEAVGDWSLSVRAITGIDVSKLTKLLRARRRGGAEGDRQPRPVVFPAQPGRREERQPAALPAPER